MNEIEFKILKVGKLKYDRVKSMSILRHELNSFGYEYSLNDTKELFDVILKGELKEYFNRKFKHCIDTVFIDNEYEQIGGYEQYSHFPHNWIPPQGGVGGYIIE